MSSRKSGLGRKSSQRPSQRTRDRKQERKEQLEDQQNQQLRARVDNILIASTSSIYAGLVVKEWDGGEPEIPRDVLLKLASLAKTSANVLGESLKMIKPPQAEVPPQDDDKVVEIPAAEEPQDSGSVVASDSDVVDLSSEEPSRSVDPSIMSSGSEVISLEISQESDPPKRKRV